MYVMKLELYVNGELLDTSHDRKILSQIPLRDKTVIIAKVGYYHHHIKFLTYRCSSLAWFTFDSWANFVV